MAQKDNLEKIIGTHESYIMYNTDKSVRKSIIVLDSNNIAKCKSSSGERYEGKFHMPSRQILIIKFSSTKNKHSFFYVTLKVFYDRGIDLLYGIFAGVGTYNLPTGGRELFKKVGTVEDYEKIEPDLIKIGSNEFDKLIAEIPELITFFTGKKNNFLDDIKLIKELETYNSNNKKTRKTADNIDKQKVRWRNLIAKANIEEALNEIIDYSEEAKNETLNTDIIKLSSRWNRIKDYYGNGLLDDEVKERQINKIIETLIDTIKKIT